MSEETEQKPITEPEIAESETKQSETATPPKKSPFGLYLFILILLGAGGSWIFWQNSPLVSQFKELWLSKSSSIMALVQQQPTEETLIAEEQGTEENITDEEPIAEPPHETPVPQTNLFEAIDSPVFESAPEIKLEHELSTTPDIQAKNLEELKISVQTSMQQMKNQIALLHENIKLMNEHQNKQAQQYVRAQLFAALQKASSPLSNSDDMKAAWKSISFMPLLSEDKKAAAEQAYADLQNMQSNKLQITEEISAWVASLAEQISPEKRADVAELIEEANPATPPTDSIATGIEWLKKQFVITKVTTNTPVYTGNDPYADIKRFINHLLDLQQLLNSGGDKQPQDLDIVFHQLAQHGIETSLTPEDFINLYETKQSWKDQAQAWMEQL